MSVLLRVPRDPLVVVVPVLVLLLLVVQRLQRALAGRVIRRLDLRVVHRGGGLMLLLVMRGGRGVIPRSVVAAPLLAPWSGSQRVRSLLVQRLLVESLLRRLLDDSLVRHGGEDGRKGASIRRAGSGFSVVGAVRV